MKYLCPRDFRRGEMEEYMNGFELVMVILFLLGILTVSIRQHLWIWRLDQTTPNDTETVRRLFFLRKIKPEP